MNLFDETLFAQTRDDPLTDKPDCQLSYRDTYHEWMQPIFVNESYFRFYYQLQENVDQQIGRVYRALRRSSFWRNTVVVFTSDHGDLLGSHGDMHQKWYQAYEETLHVPLTIVDPRVRRRKRVPRIGIETSHADVLPTLLGLAGLDAEALRNQIAPDFSDANPPVGRNLSGLIQGLEDPADHDEPVFFMTDDDPSRGPDQDNFIGIARASVIQPNHIETVIARLDGRVWKYSRYFDNPQFWSAPGTPGDPGVMDVVSLEIGSSDMPTSGIVPYERTVKTVPECTQYEMYDVSGDPLELSNLAEDAAFATERQILEALLEEQCLAKRSTPSAATGSVPGQPDCSSEDSCG
ncbi:MAG: sulfatase-like hydrolase/transferase [Myxococcota bacterium]